MNKEERKLKGQFKFIKRLKNYGFKLEDVFKENHNLFAFKTTGNQCNCWMCKSPKFNRKLKHNNEVRKEIY